MKKQSAFTLIEVLIALMIIAIALAAVIHAMNQSIRVTDKVKEDMAAHWVAMNALSEIQLGMIRMPEEGDPVFGKADMFDNTWQWEALLNTDMTTHYAGSVKVIVNRQKKQVTSLSGFVR